MPVSGVHRHGDRGFGGAATLALALAALACGLAAPARAQQPASPGPAQPQAPIPAEIPAETPAQAQPPGAPAAAPPPPPEADPALAAPLTPLEQFQVQPATPPSETTRPPPVVRYTVQIEGLDEAGLEGRFRDLSALEEGRGRAESRLQIKARADTDETLIRRLLRSEGYYAGDARITIARAAPGQLTVKVAVTPGPQFHFGRIDITGPQTTPPGLARKALTLEPGDPIVAEDVEAAEANVSLRLPQQGYPFVKVGDRDISLDPDTRLGDYLLPVSPGPRSSFSGFQLKGDRVFTPGHMAVIARFKPGELYDSRKVDDFRRALVATGLFSSLGVTPVDAGTRAADGTEKTDLEVQAQAAPTHTISASAGYETGVGAKFEASWTDRNLFPPEGALTVRGIAGADQQLVGVQFRRSNFGRRDRTLQAQIQASRETVKAYTAYTGSIGARISRDSTPIWQKRWTYSAGVQAVVSRESAYDVSLGEVATRTYKIAALPLQGGYDRSNSLLNPTRGFKLLATLTPQMSFGNGRKTFVSGTLEGRGYVPVSDALVLAGRIRTGALFGASAFELPPTRRFYEGGGASIRGFGYQDVGPKAPDGSPLGGASFVDFSAEARYRFGDFGVVAFMDGGQLYESSTPGFGDFRYGVGVGARYYTNFGPIRLDVAMPVSRRPGEARLGLYISIGQAF